MTESKSPPRIQVICAGLGRTGTMSLTDALTALGYKSYHYVEVSHSDQWAKVARGEATSDPVIDLIADEGYTAVLENPCSDIYQDILQKYPKAKVILTVRDSPEKFEASWKTLFETMVITEEKFSWRFPSFWGYIPLFSNLREIRQFMGTTHLGLPRGALTHGWRDKPNGWIGEQYTRHNQHVRENVPADQLLVFNVKEGWKPLCDFLECEVPEGDFPHSKVNDTKALKQLRRTFLFVVYSWIPIVVTVGAAGAFYWKSGSSTRVTSSSSTREL